MHVRFPPEWCVVIRMGGGVAEEGVHRIDDNRHISSSEGSWDDGCMLNISMVVLSLVAHEENEWERCFGKWYNLKWV